jgi:hypothetical protein
MMCTLEYQITLSEIRPEKRRTWHCGAETAWCVYEKAEFGVLDEDTTHPKDNHHRWTIRSALVVLNLSLIPERGTEGPPSGTVIRSAMPNPAVGTSVDAGGGGDRSLHSSYFSNSSFRKIHTKERRYLKQISSHWMQ